METRLETKRRQMKFNTPPPLSLYIHVPWCIRKCPYCDFNSHNSPEQIPESNYVDALLKDLELELEDVDHNRIINSIFIGGGTPSLFSAEAYHRLFSEINQRITIATDAEITLEANPGTFEQQRFADYRTAGINRLSIGIQSFDEHALQKLGRVHDRQQAIKAAETAHKVGFDNFNLDLMFGLPDQTAKLAKQDVETAIRLAPTHISYYQLTLEPNTLFHQRPPVLPEDDAIIDWQLENQARLANAGYIQYEVSAYAQQNKQCKHNLNYWRFGDYIGIGAGAHGKLTHVSTASVIRRSKQKQPQKYIETAGTPACIQTNETIAKDDMGFEFMLNALRLNNGFNINLFTDMTGLPLSTIQSSLDQALSEDLITIDKEMLRPTQQGQRYLNSLIELFLPE
jgi:oxygen-independent coproporphyrinogen-3 oxidase